MPFTPFHMRIGIFTKALLQGGFSLMVFGWAQIIMDIQPLIVMLSGEGHLHGFSHTYLGASLLAIVSALTGKHLSEPGLLFLNISRKSNPIKISWVIAFISAFIGAYSHVLLDSFMHSDLQPFYPVYLENDFLDILDYEQIHKLCLYSGLVGAGIYYLVQFYHKKTITRGST